VRRRRSIAVALVLALALVAAACGDDDEGSGGAGSPTGTRQELRVGFTADQYVLEGPDAALGAYPLNTNVLETLTYLSPTYEVKPLLADRWEFRAPNTWRFFLHQGIKFHDGQPFNAQAVKTGLFDRVAAQRGGGTIKAGPNSAVVVDEYIIDFTPTAPNLRVPEQIVHPNNAVIAPGANPGRNPVGTGPFRFVEYLPKERIVVERNPDYWGTKAGLERITFRFYPDPSARRLALEAGDIDFAFDIPRPDVKALKGRGLNIVNSPVGAYEAMYLNIHGTGDRDILSEVNVRKAIAHAIDRKSLVDNVLEGQATMDQTFVPPGSLAPYESMVKGFQFDQARARSLLDQAGWTVGGDGIRTKGARRLRLQLVSGFPSAEVHKPIPTFLQSQLRAVGIDVEIVERPDSASYQALITSGQGDVFMEQGNQNDANPAFLPVLLFATSGSGASAPYPSLFGPGGRFDEIMSQTLTEPDAMKVRQLTAEGMHQIIDEEAVVIPLAGIFRIYGMKDTVQGFTPHASFLNVRWEGVSLK
jgi:peptide/nickel transport system substrate-binding protein